MTLLTRRVISPDSSLVTLVEVFCQIHQIGTVLQEIQDFSKWVDTVETVAMMAAERIPDPDDLVSDNRENFDYNEHSD